MKVPEISVFRCYGQPTRPTIDGGPSVRSQQPRFEGKRTRKSFFRIILVCCVHGYFIFYKKLKNVSCEYHRVNG